MFWAKIAPGPKQALLALGALASVRLGRAQAGDWRWVRRGHDVCIVPLLLAAVAGAKVVGEEERFRDTAKSDLRPMPR